jgi:hypothetical protein
MRLSLRLALLTLLALPLAAWAFFRPIRVLAPELAGVRCYSGGVCSDDPERVSEALSLKLEAVQFVQRKIGKIENVPRMIFCSSLACEKSFGFTGNASYNVGTSGLVVASRGWRDYYVRHELIHHVQGERLGVIRLWLFTPKWFIEGMAYSLSDDPRHPLQEPFEGFRSKYERWASQIPSQALWSRAEEL